TMSGDNGGNLPHDPGALQRRRGGPYLKPLPRREHRCVHVGSIAKCELANDFTSGRTAGLDDRSAEGVVPTAPVEVPLSGWQDPTQIIHTRLLSISYLFARYLPLVANMKAARGYKLSDVADFVEGEAILSGEQNAGVSVAKVDKKVRLYVCAGKELVIDNIVE